MQLEPMGYGWYFWMSFWSNYAFEQKVAQQSSVLSGHQASWIGADYRKRREGLAG
jgi:hypothetical protein